jgi:hypothetical protein
MPDETGSERLNREIRERFARSRFGVEAPQAEEQGPGPPDDPDFGAGVRQPLASEPTMNEAIRAAARGWTVRGGVK